MAGNGGGRGYQDRQRQLALRRRNDDWTPARARRLRNRPAAQMGMPKKLFQKAKQPPELAEIQGIIDKERLLSLSVYCRDRFRHCLPPHPQQAGSNVRSWPRFYRRPCRISDPLSPMLSIKQVSNR
jgi:hypothetical protein